MSENFNPDGSIYFVGHKMKVEFLGPERGNGRKPGRHIPEIEVTPQLLHYLDVLFEEPLVLTIAKVIQVNVPSPAAFSLHKLIIAMHFKWRNKKSKDLRQDIYVGKYVLSKPNELDKMQRLWTRLPKPWRRKIARALYEALDVVPLELGVIRRL